MPFPLMLLLLPLRHLTPVVGAALGEDRRGVRYDGGIQATLDRQYNTGQLCSELLILCSAHSILRKMVGLRRQG